MSEDRYRSVVDNSPYGIYRVSYDGSFVTVNPALCAIIGYSAEELFASNIVTLYPSAAERQRWLADYEQRPPGAPVELQWKRRDDQLITVRIWVYAQRAACGKIEYLDGYVEDVTTLRATEQALRQSERLAALGELVSGVAHELNNPLSAILLFAEDLLGNEQRVEEREALGIIAQQARRSRSIVRDLLSFARTRDAVREPVESGPFFAQLSRGLEPQLAELSVTLHTSIDACQTLLPIDRAGIEQVVTNLVMNAAQAADAGGNVWLAASRDARDFVIEVRDDGPGIPLDVLPQIFEPFFTTKPTGQGTGLGLSVSRGVVEQHGGRIDAANRDRREGSGAHFTVRIPLSTETVGPCAPAVDAEVDANPPAARRVLIIDDEATIRQALTRFYQRRGWVVAQAADGLVAVERLIGGGEPFDLVISDVKMPGVSGIELHAALRDVRPELLDRLLFCTGEVESPAVSAFVASTSCHVLMKPFDLRTLASVSDDIASRRTPAMPKIAS